MNKDKLLIEKTGTYHTEYKLVKIGPKKQKIFFRFDSSFLGIRKVTDLIKLGKINYEDGVELMKQIYILPIPIVKCRIWNEFHRVQKTHEYLKKCLNIIKKFENKILKQIAETHMLSMN